MSLLTRGYGTEHQLIVSRGLGRTEEVIPGPSPLVFIDYAKQTHQSFFGMSASFDAA